MSNLAPPNRDATRHHDWCSPSGELHFRTHPVPDAVTVVIITRDRCESLRRTLQKLDESSGIHEVIVVDNTSTACSVTAICDEFARVRLVSLGRNRGAAARNIGVAEASTEIVAFCDDDSWWEPEAIPRALAYFRAYPSLGLLAGTVLVGPERRVDPVSCQQAISPLLETTPLPGTSILGFLACAAMVRTTAFLQVGGYAEFLGFGGEEELLALDLASTGWGLSFTSDVIARHFPAPRRHTARRQIKQTRNHIWIAWLRRPWPAAARVTLTALRDSGRSWERAIGFIESFIRLPQVVKFRQIVSREIENRICLLERQRGIMVVHCLETTHAAERDR